MVAFERRDPAPESLELRQLVGAGGQIRHRSASASNRMKQETAPGSRWPIDRSPSRSARPRRAMSGRVDCMPARAGLERRALGRRARATRGDRRGERFGRWAERVEDRLVADRAAAAPGKSRGRGNEHLGDSGGRSVAASPARNPASMNAVP